MDENRLFPESSLGKIVLLTERRRYKCPKSEFRKKIEGKNNRTKTGKIDRKFDEIFDRKKDRKRDFCSFSAT